MGQRDHADKFHVVPGLQDIAGAPHGITAVCEHDAPYAPVIDIFDDGLGKTAHIRVRAGLCAGKS